MVRVVSWMSCLLVFVSEFTALVYLSRLFHIPVPPTSCAWIYNTIINYCLVCMDLVVSILGGPV
jgi:hypothetical protein